MKICNTQVLFHCVTWRLFADLESVREWEKCVEKLLRRILVQKGTDFDFYLYEKKIKYR